VFTFKFKWLLNSFYDKSSELSFLYKYINLDHNNNSFNNNNGFHQFSVLLTEVNFETVPGERILFMAEFVAKLFFSCCKATNLACNCQINC